MCKARSMPLPANCRAACPTAFLPQNNPSDAPIMVLAMTSDTQPFSEVYNLADQIIGQRISQMDGVSQVIIGGGANSAVRVQINPVALASMGLSLEDIRTTLSQANVLSPKGTLEGPEQSSSSPATIN